NLPRPLTRFFGHEADFDEYARAVAEHRLVTLTGVGGCGKTRFATELAHRLVPNFPDGVWFVDFAPVADAERVPSVVATALGAKERPNQPILQVLLDYGVTSHRACAACTAQRFRVGRRVSIIARPTLARVAARHPLLRPTRNNASAKSGRRDMKQS